MVNYKLIYFNGRGRAEITRLLFAQAGQKFEDVRYDHSEWGSHKSEMPLGQMPVLEVDGVKLPQSLTIARYVAKTFNLAGKDNLDQAKADAVVDTIADLMQKLAPLMFEKDETKKQQGIKTFVQDELPKHMQNLETLQTQFGGSGPFFVNNSLSWADLLWLEVSSNLTKLNPSVLDKYQKLKRVRQEVEKQPKIAAYLQSRPDTPF